MLNSDPALTSSTLDAARPLRDGLDTVETATSRESDGETLATLRARLLANILARIIAEGRTMTIERAGAEALAAVGALADSSDALLLPSSAHPSDLLPSALAVHPTSRVRLSVRP